VVGLICGSGLLPVRVSQVLGRHGARVVAVCIKGEADERVEQVTDQAVWTGIARLGKWVKVFRKENVEVVLLAGGITKEAMFASRTSLMPDWRSAKLILKQVSNRADHTILGALADEFEKEGMRVGSVLDYCPELLVQRGCLTRREPDADQWEDIRYAWPMIKKIAEMQIGQTIVVRDQAVVAVESIDGTDATLRRGGELARGNAVAVKVAKEGHDPRFDIPTLGPDTVVAMEESGVEVLAVEAGGALMLDLAEVKRLADEAGVCVIAVTEEDIATPEEA
jgi:hypothetical protein